MREQIAERFRSNIARAKNLVSLFEALGGRGRGRRPVHATDTLRAAVVFLHAALEECLRTLYVWKMPYNSEASLNTVPLVGSQSHRAEKFYLGRLAEHRTKSVQQLIADSVHAQAMALSMNNAADIASVLKVIGLRPEDYEASLARVSLMIERRHHIVHQADRNDAGGRGQQQARPINNATVNEWIVVVEQFGLEVIAAVPDDLI